MNREIRKLLLFLVPAALILLATDITIGLTLEKLYDRMRTGEKARANFAIKKASPDVFIFGSSRALYHYNPKVLEDSLKLTVYNAGRSNQSVLYHLAILRSILNRHQPKLIVLDVNEDELEQEALKYELLSALYPYYHIDTTIGNFLRKVDPSTNTLALSRSLPFNSTLFAVLYRGVFPGEGRGEDYNGYMYKERTHEEDIKVEDNCGFQPTYDPALINSLNEFITLCQSRHIPLVLSISPRFTRFNCDRPEVVKIERIAQSRNVRFFNFTRELQIREYFVDPGHLNVRGSIEYTSLFAQELRKLPNY